MEASPSITTIYRNLVREGYDVLVSHLTKTRLNAESSQGSRLTGRMLELWQNC